jgi:hypothetical protein
MLPRFWNEFVQLTVILDSFLYIHDCNFNRQDHSLNDSEDWVIIPLVLARQDMSVEWRFVP